MGDFVVQRFGPRHRHALARSDILGGDARNRFRRPRGRRRRHDGSTPAELAFEDMPAAATRIIFASKDRRRREPGHASLGDMPWRDPDLSSRRGCCTRRRAVEGRWMFRAGGGMQRGGRRGECQPCLDERGLRSSRKADGGFPCFEERGLCAAPGWDGKHSEWGEPSFRSVTRRQGDRVPLASTPVPDGAVFNIGDAARSPRWLAAATAISTALREAPPLSVLGRIPWLGALEPRRRSPAPRCSATFRRSPRFPEAPLRTQ